MFAAPALAAEAVAQLELAPSGSSPATERFTLAGVHWQGTGRVLFRTRSLTGRWSAWRSAAPEPEDGPDPGSRELRLRAGWRIGNPWWVGPSDRIQTRSIGRVSRVRAFLVRSPEGGAPLRAPAAATLTTQPTIVPRRAWGANESIRRGSPSYAPAIRYSVVHHTAGANGYSRAQAPAIVKGIQLYHVRSNGWNDIGYNYLVDRFGTIYEGRYGGIDKNVVGAHAGGFNTGAVGIALLGTYGSASPSQAAQDAIAKLIAWRLDLAHVDPTRTSTAVSGGNEKYRRGASVSLRHVSGHRDTGSTTCPGNVLYGRLDALALAASKMGLPKLYEPLVEEVEGVYRFRARVSASLPWFVSVTDAAGLEVARGVGTGRTVDWSWDSTLTPAGQYTWTFGAGTARPASGPLTVTGVSAPLAVDALATPQGITPNADGQADDAVVSYKLSKPANTTVEVRDAVGTVVLTVVDRVWTRAGDHTVTVPGAGLADGLYNVVVIARTVDDPEVQKVVPLTVSRTLGLVTLAPALFSPNGDGRLDKLDIRFSLAAAASVRVRVLRDGRWIATLVNTSYQAGPQRFTWNGQRASGAIRDGSYVAVLDATDAVGTVAVEVPFVSDSTAPRVEILPGTRLRLRVSEPATLFLRIDGVTQKRAARRAGIVTIPGAGAARSVRVVAHDAAGNASKPVFRSR
jgi:hypothetical protein